MPVAVESLKGLLDRRSQAISEARQLLDKVEAEGRPLSAEEQSHYERIEADVEGLCDQIEAQQSQSARREKLSAWEAKLADPKPLGRQSQPSQILPELPRGASEAALRRFDLGRSGKIDLDYLEEMQPAAAAQLKKRAAPEYGRAFQLYLMGAERNYERLGLIVGDDTKGGYLAPMTWVSGLIKFLDDMVTMRQLGTVLPPTTAKSVGMLSFDTDYGNADWTAEVPASDITQDSAARFGGREMTPHLLTKLVKSSKKMLRSSSLPIESFLQQRLAYRFARTENAAFMTGTGSQQPLGVYTASTYGIPTSRDLTASSSTTFTADDLIDLFENVKDAYRERGTLHASRTFRKVCRKLKDGDGQYLLTEGMNNVGTPMTTILSRPLVVDENAPSTFTTGQYVAVFGDFSFYWIQDGLGYEVQRLDELFALTNQVGWLGSKETDAMPVLAEAFTRLKLG